MSVEEIILVVWLGSGVILWCLCLFCDGWPDSWRGRDNDGWRNALLLLPLTMILAPFLWAVLISNRR